MKLAVFILLATIASPLAAQEIILRDLSRIQNVSVDAVEDQFLVLSNGQEIGWDKILKARVDPVWQKQLDRRIEKIGLPLYRLRHRLSQKNYSGAYDLAQDWFDNNEQAFVGAESNFLVCRAMMLGRIGKGQSVQAVDPMIRAIEFQEKCSPVFLESIPNLRFDDHELKTTICDGFLPIWNSLDETKAELDRLSANFDLDELVRKWPGLGIYLSSMAVHANQRERMVAWNAAIGSARELRPWQRVLGSDLSRAPLSRLLSGDSPLRVTTMYWWATAEGQQAPETERVLTLLKIVANYSKEYPALAEEARKSVIELSNDQRLKQILQKEK